MPFLRNEFLQIFEDLWLNLWWLIFMIKIIAQDLRLTLVTFLTLLALKWPLENYSKRKITNPFRQRGSWHNYIIFRRPSFGSFRSVQKQLFGTKKCQEYLKLIYLWLIPICVFVQVLKWFKMRIFKSFF